MKNSVTFRPKSNYVWGGVALLLDALYLAQALFYSVDGENIWFDLGLVALVAALAVALWLRPKLVLNDEHLIVVNPLNRFTIRYSDIIDLDTKWALVIQHSGGLTRVWVAQANGKFRWIADTNQNRILGKAPRNQGSVVDITSASQSLNSDSGLAAHMIRERLKGLH